MTYQFVIQGRLPSLNEYIKAERSGWQAANSMKRKWQEYITAYIMLARLPRINKPVTIRYRFYEKNTRRDLDNVSGYAHKVIQDALVCAGVLVDDSWGNVQGYMDEFQVDSKNPRIEVDLDEVEGEE